VDRIEVWRRFLRSHARLVEVLGTELERECGLPLSWYDVLVNLAAAPGGKLRMTELARAVLLSRSGLTRLVDRMVAAGYVERRACPSDRRGALAVLTPVGREALRAAAPVHLRGIGEHFLDKLGDEDLAALARVWDTVED
jgi:DNA-binding MarR family transcriptional regulator